MCIPRLRLSRAITALNITIPDDSSIHLFRYFTYSFRVLKKNQTSFTFKPYGLFRKILLIVMSDTFLLCYECIILKSICNVKLNLSTTKMTEMNYTIILKFTQCSFKVCNFVILIFYSFVMFFFEIFTLLCDFC